MYSVTEKRIYLIFGLIVYFFCIRNWEGSFLISHILSHFPKLGYICGLESANCARICLIFFKSDIIVRLRTESDCVCGLLDGFRFSILMIIFS